VAENPHAQESGQVGQQISPQKGTQSKNLAASILEADTTVQRICRRRDNRDGSERHKKPVHGDEGFANCR
jgi:hypothetical protein